MSNNSKIERAQSGILADLPNHGRYLELRISSGAAKPVLIECLQRLQAQVDGEGVVVGFGSRLLQYFGVDDLDLHFKSYDQHQVSVPSTAADLWIWIRSEEAGFTFHQSELILGGLADGFDVVAITDGFKFNGGRDLTGYEDGTENPTGDDAIDAALQADGSSIVAVQKWRHNLRHFSSLSQDEQDDIIGRRLSDNVEFEGSPSSAHVKRTAQESFDPEAFMVRRSMPYSEGEHAGLMFVCFAHSTQPFNQQMNRMVGGEDGITDGLFQFSQPITGSFYWCPPVKDEQLDLSKLSI